VRVVRQKAINACAPKRYRVGSLLCRPGIVSLPERLVRLSGREAIAIVRDGTDEVQSCEDPLQLEGGV
jgi:hypothetical protein